MNLEMPIIGPNAGKNIVTIMVIKAMICVFGKPFHINEVIPPFNPTKERMSPINFSTKVPRKEGIFFIVAFVLFLTLSQNDFSL